MALWQYRTPLLVPFGAYALDDLAGFALAVVFGLFLGVALGASKLVHAGTYPMLVGFNAIPKVAVVPILVIWFGVGWVPAVLTAFLISFFPIVVNVATGLATIEPEVEDVMRALGASKLDIIQKVGIPRSMPYFFGSLKVAMTLAYVGSRDRRVQRFELRDRQPDGPRQRGLQRPAAVRRIGRPRRARRHHLRRDGRA